MADWDCLILKHYLAQEILSRVSIKISVILHIVFAVDGVSMEVCSH